MMPVLFSDGRTSTGGGGAGGGVVMALRMRNVKKMGHLGEGGGDDIVHGARVLGGMTALISLRVVDGVEEGVFG